MSSVMDSKSVALALAPQPRAASYARYAVAHPITLLALSLATSVAGALAGIVGAAIAAPLVVTAGAGLAWLAPVQRALERSLARRAKQDRERDRLLRLAPAGPVRQQQYVCLRELVDAVEETRPGEARRYELQDLLDRYIAVAVVHARCQRALDAPSAKIEVTRERSERTNEIVARRLRHRDDCKRRLEQLADQLDALEQLVHLVADRVTCPEVDDTTDAEIDRRLCDLELADEAVRELSA
jgi:hypothetical protein